MISKIKENIILYAPVYLICILLLGWLFVSLFENYFLITLYPIYVSVLLTGLGMVKYQERELKQTPRYALDLELKLFPRLMIGGIAIIVMLLILDVLAWELLVIPFLVILVIGVRILLIRNLVKIQD